MFKKYLLNFLFLLPILAFVFSPLSVVLAQNTGGTSAPAITCDLPSNAKISDIFAHITCIIYQTLIPMFFALAVALFVWGVVQYVISTADEGRREKGKTFMVWGIIGITVMISVWGLVAVLGDTFGLNTSVIPKAPE